MRKSVCNLGVVLVASVFTLGLCGCQTTSEDGYPKAPDKILFVPVVHDVTIQAGEGRYPGLYTGASHANWQARAPVAAVPAAPAMEASASADAQAMESAEPAVVAMAPRTQGLKITCYLESSFSDMSIAYDAVSLRGQSVYLQLPDGREVSPSQKVVDTELSEIPVGALRRYGRNLTLYFPENTFMVENPAANPAARGVRLVIEGQQSTFYFEWQPTPNFLAHTEPRADYQLRDGAKRHYKSTSRTAKDILHTFD